MISMNSLAALAGVILGWNTISSIFLLSFYVIFNVSLPWIMFHVMDKY
jgi:hypothetical protein